MSVLGGFIVAVFTTIATIVCLFIVIVALSQLGQGPLLGAGIGLVIGASVAVGSILKRAMTPPKVTSQPRTFTLPDHLLVVQGQSGWFWCQRCRQQMYGIAQVNAMPCEPSSLD